MLNWLLNFFKSNPFFTGVISDQRTNGEKQQDYLHEERNVSVSADPFGNSQITLSPYPYENQLSTSECVPHAVGLALSIERKTAGQNFEQLSPSFVYRLRSNYSNAGSAPQNVFNIYKNTGAPLFTTLPTPQTEQEANALILSNQMYTEAQIYRGATYYTLGTPNDISTIAQIIQQGHPVAITLFATEDEYSRQYPVILTPSLTYAQAAVQHEVCVLPYSGFIKDGIKYVAIQDSAWFGGWKLRYLSETFIKTRVYGAMYWIGSQTLSVGPKPNFKFTQTLQFGSRSNEVIYMQRFLVSEGLLPSDCVTGYFGGYTLAAVKAFQAKYASDILLPVGLMAPTGIWGPSSIKKANSLQV